MEPQCVIRFNGGVLVLNQDSHFQVLGALHVDTDVHDAKNSTTEIVAPITASQRALDVFLDVLNCSLVHARTLLETLDLETVCQVATVADYLDARAVVAAACDVVIAATQFAKPSCGSTVGVKEYDCVQSAYTRTQPVDCFVIDKDRLLVEFIDHTAEVWTTFPLRESVRLQGKVHKVVCVALTPDDTLVIGLFSGEVGFWDLSTGRLTSLACTANGSSPVITFAVLSNDLTLICRISEMPFLWDRAACRRAELEPHLQPLSLATLDNNMLVAGYWSGEVVVWDVSGPQHKKHLTAMHQHLCDPVESITRLPLNRFASGSSSGCIIVWNALNLQQLAVFHLVRPFGSLRLSALSDGTLCLVTYNFSTLLWSPTSESCIERHDTVFSPYPPTGILMGCMIDGTLVDYEFNFTLGKPKLRLWRKLKNVPERRAALAETSLGHTLVETIIRDGSSEVPTFTSVFC